MDSRHLAALPESLSEKGNVRDSPSPAKGGSSLSEDAIWKRIREAGFDEDMVKRRDNAALIAYVARLESQIYDYQCNMELILLEKKDLESKYNEIKVSSEAAEIIYKCDKTAYVSAFEEARKCEENLKNVLGIEKECLTMIEKTLQEMHAESAKTKVAYEIKLAEAQSMVETAQRMVDEAKSKSHDAEASQAEARRRQNIALRTLQDVDAREDELSRRIVTFHTDCYESEENSQSFATILEKFQAKSTRLKKLLEDECLDLFNKGSEEELNQLKGIGKKRARYMIEFREELAEPFKKVNDLKGLGLSSKQIKGLLSKIISDI